MTEIFHYATDDGIATITWDLPGASMNVLDEQGIAVLDAHVDTALADAAVTGVIITSAKKDFAGGMDLNVIARMKGAAEAAGGDPAETIFGFVMGLHGVLRKIECAGADPKTHKGGKPFVWACPGTAMGIGTEIGLACHRRIAADNPKAKIGLPEILVGLFPGSGGTTRLVRMLGLMGAAPFLLEGKTPAPSKARSAGLIDAGEHETMLEAACCKMYATERLWDIANNALQVTGGTGFMREYPYERILRDARINMIFEGTNQILRMMIAFQGLRSLGRGELGSPEGPARMAGVAERLAPQREELEELVPLFAQRCRAALEQHGKGIRDAQFVQHRLADMATSLFVSGAVLSRATASDSAGQLDEVELDLAALACARAHGNFRRALLEEERPLDELVERVARHATR